MTLVSAVETDAETPPDAGRPRLVDLSAPLMLFAATRVVQLLFIVWLAPGGGPSVKDRLLAWDGDWFMRVAAEGYPHAYSYDVGGHMVGNGLAFFPAYPLLIRGLWRLGLPADVHPMRRPAGASEGARPKAIYLPHPVAELGDAGREDLQVVRL